MVTYFNFMLCLWKSKHVSSCFVTPLTCFSRGFDHPSRTFFLYFLCHFEAYRFLPRVTVSVSQSKTALIVGLVVCHLSFLIDSRKEHLRVFFLTIRI